MRLLEAEPAEWASHLRHLEERFEFVKDTQASCVRFPPGKGLMLRICQELKVEYPLVTAATSELETWVPRLTAEVKRASAGGLRVVGPELGMEVAEMESLLRRTELRVFAILDSMPGGD
jgi:hypothetical protein